MPFKPVPMPKCPKCDKSVYAAEEKLGEMTDIGRAFDLTFFHYTNANKYHGQVMGSV